MQERDWFNPELRSADSIVPGVIAMVMTMAGTLLTAGGVSREWEHGTMESMLASPGASGELILARLGCNFVLGMGSMAVSLLLAVFAVRRAVPRRPAGAGRRRVAVPDVRAGLGLFISTLARNQFVAVADGVPDHDDAGDDAVRHAVRHRRDAALAAASITYLVPARYLVSILQTLFLAGDVWAVLLPNLAALALAATLAVTGTVLVTRRRLD